MKFNQCEQFKQECDQLKTLHQEFNSEYQKAIKTGKLDKALALKQEMEARLASLEKKLWPFEHLPQKELKKQYESQKQILEKVGLLEKLSSGELGIKGIDNQEYAFPSFQEITKRLREKREIIKTKTAQGFQKLLIVPWGMKLDDLIAKYQQVILKHYQQGKLLATKEKPSDPDEPLDLNEEEPVWVWNQYENADLEGKLIYYPQEFSDNHHGKTKKQILDQTKQGFNVLLIEDLPNIPRQGKGKTIQGRKQWEANKTPQEYLKALQTDPAYQSEQGLTPEDQIIYAITYLEQFNQVIDDQFRNGSGSFQIGAYFPASARVPGTGWDSNTKRAGLGRSGPGEQFSIVGIRSGVRIN